MCEQKKKALIYSQNLDLLKQIDDGLWNFSKTKFLPHAGDWEDVEVQRQPILLTNKEENQNQAEFLIKLDQASDDFVKSFEKTFYFFGNANLQEARKLWVYYKGKTQDLDFYKQQDGRWNKVKL